MNLRIVFIESFTVIVNAKSVNRSVRPEPVEGQSLTTTDEALVSVSIASQM